MPIKLESSTPEKSEKILRMAYAIIKDRAQNGNAVRLNIAGLAKDAGVSRPWIYKNFGSSNLEITKSAIDILAPFITQPVKPMSDWHNKSIREWLKHFHESLEITLEQVEKFPELFRFYIQTRLERSELSELLADHEYRFAMQIVRPRIDSKTKSDFEFSKVMAEHLVSVRIGLIFKWLTASGRSKATHRRELASALKEIEKKLKD